MNGPMKGCAIVCLLGLWACDVEHYESCDVDDAWCECDDGGFGHGASPSGGTGAAAGTPSDGARNGGGASGAGSSSAGTANLAGNGAAGAPDEPPAACDEERDCGPGFNCDASTRQCLPSEQETCGELTREAACENRRDCVPVYGGIDCSCGADCECRGGEPGCVCQSFDFVLCRAAD